MPATPRDRVAARARSASGAWTSPASESSRGEIFETPLEVLAPGGELLHRLRRAGDVQSDLDAAAHVSRAGARARARALPLRASRSERSPKPRPKSAGSTASSSDGERLDDASVLEHVLVALLDGRGRRARDGGQGAERHEHELRAVDAGDAGKPRVVRDECVEVEHHADGCSRRSSAGTDASSRRRPT